MKRKSLWIILLIIIAFILGDLTFTTKIKKEKKEPKVIKKIPKQEELIPQISKKVIVGENAIADAVEIARPSVVNIDVVSVKKEEAPFGEFFGEDKFFKRFFGDDFEDFFKREYKQQGSGSGFIISKDGYVVTNAHVIQDSTEIKITLVDKREFKGKVVGVDKTLDIAIIKINANGLPVAILGDSDKVRLGEWVIAIGNPFGYGQTVTAGIISAKGRSLQEERGTLLKGLIQTDAAINRGNSGGPLANLRGEVIGINTAIISPTGTNLGIGFAIPINSAKEILDELIKHGKVVRPWIGVMVVQLDKQTAKFLGLPDTDGALIREVSRNSPAEKAGLKPGYVIRELNGKKIKGPEELVKEVRKHKVKETIALLIWDYKQKNTRFVTLTLKQMP